MLSVPARRAVVVGVGSHLPDRPEDPLDRAASVHTAQCEAKVGPGGPVLAPFICLCTVSVWKTGVLVQKPHAQSFASWQGHALHKYTQYSPTHCVALHVHSGPMQLRRPYRKMSILWTPYCLCCTLECFCLSAHSTSRM